MVKQPFSIAAELKQEEVLAPNCFTLGRFGQLVEGIELSLNRGPDPVRPWSPHVLVGDWRVGRDTWKGALFTASADGTCGVMRRACVRKVEREGKPTFFTLKRPESEKLDFSLIRLSTAMRMPQGLWLNGHELRIHSGWGGTGTVLAQGGNLASTEALIALEDGEVLNCFYPDGAVRVFRQCGALLMESQLTDEEMISLRIEDAKERMSVVLSSVMDEDRRQKAVRFILSGMADMLHLTTLRKEVGQVLRIALMRDLFFAIHPEYLGLVRRKIEAILHQVDRPLLAMFYEGDRVFVSTVSTVMSNVTNLAAERAKRDAARRARQLERAQQGPKKGPGGQKQTRASNPEKVAKRARKEALRKK